MTATSPRPGPPPSPAGSIPAVTVDALGHRYGERRALGEVSFTIEAGEVFGVLGPNGGGKSTLFRILSTMIEPTEGAVRLFGGEPGRNLTAVRRDLGVVFQSPSLDPILTARENLIHQGHLYGLRGKALKQREEELLARFGLGDRVRERVSRFSGGMRRRLEIAKALLHRPRLLILDEPSTGLDPAARRDMWNLLLQLRESEGVTVVFTTHLMDEAEVCDRLAILDAGRLIAVDTPANLKEKVGGDVVTLESDDPDGLTVDVNRRFEVGALAVGDRVRFERPRGHEFVTKLVEAFPGRIRSVSVGKPTLEDVFLDLTGHRFEEADAPEPQPQGRRGHRR